MPRPSALTACRLICDAGAAQAQTVLARAVLAPSGDSAVTQPGGIEGHAARRSIQDAIRNGAFVGPPPASVGHGENRMDRHGIHRPVGTSGRR